MTVAQDVSYCWRHNRSYVGKGDSFYISKRSTHESLELHVRGELIAIKHMPSGRVNARIPTNNSSPRMCLNRLTDIGCKIVNQRIMSSDGRLYPPSRAFCLVNEGNTMGKIHMSLGPPSQNS